MSRSGSVLPHNLAAARAASGLSREQAALVIGRSWSTVRAYELGTATPPLEVLLDLADLYGVTVSGLLGERVSASV